MTATVGTAIGSCRRTSNIGRAEKVNAMRAIGATSITATAAVVISLVAIPPGALAGAGPFDQFGGNWRGSGTVTTTGGSAERLRCRAHYDVGSAGTALRQSLTCASDSYKFNIESTVLAQGRSLSGSWTETSRNVTGAIAGSIGPSQISASVAGFGFTAQIGIAVRGGQQSIVIAPTGTEIARVKLTMTKG